MTDNKSDIISEEVPLPMLSDEVWKIILDKSNQADRFIHLLRGEVFQTWEEKDGTRRAAWIKKGNALVNERGIEDLAPIIYSMTTPDKTVTNITPEEVSRLVREMLESLVYMVHEYGDEWEIEAGKRSFVIRMLEQQYFLALTGSRRGFTMGIIKPTLHREEKYTPVQPEKRGLRLPFMR